MKFEISFDTGVVCIELTVTKPSVNKYAGFQEICVAETKETTYGVITAEVSCCSATSKRDLDVIRMSCFLCYVFKVKGRYIAL